MPEWLDHDRRGPRFVGNPFSVPADAGAGIGSDDPVVAESIPVDRLPARLRMRGPHSTGGEPLRQRVLGAFIPELF